MNDEISRQLRSVAQEVMSLNLIDDLDIAELDRRIELFQRLQAVNEMRVAKACDDFFCSNFVEK